MKELFEDIQKYPKDYAFYLGLQLLLLAESQCASLTAQGLFNKKFQSFSPSTTFAVFTALTAGLKIVLPVIGATAIDSANSNQLNVESKFQHTAFLEMKKVPISDAVREAVFSLPFSIGSAHGGIEFLHYLKPDLNADSLPMQVTSAATGYLGYLISQIILKEILLPDPHADQHCYSLKKPFRSCLNSIKNYIQQLQHSCLATPLSLLSYTAALTRDTITVGSVGRIVAENSSKNFGNIIFATTVTTMLSINHFISKQQQQNIFKLFFLYLVWNIPNALVIQYWIDHAYISEYSKQWWLQALVSANCILNSEFFYPALEYQYQLTSFKEIFWTICSSDTALFMALATFSAATNYQLFNNYITRPEVEDFRFMLPMTAMLMWVLDAVLPRLRNFTLPLSPIRSRIPTIYDHKQQFSRIPAYFFSAIIVCLCSPLANAVLTTDTVKATQPQIYLIGFFIVLTLSDQLQKAVIYNVNRLDQNNFIRKKVAFFSTSAKYYHSLSEPALYEMFNPKYLLIFFSAFCFGKTACELITTPSYFLFLATAQMSLTTMTTLELPTKYKAVDFISKTITGLIGIGCLTAITHESFGDYQNDDLRLGLLFAAVTVTGEYLERGLQKYFNYSDNQQNLQEQTTEPGCFTKIGNWLATPFRYFQNRGTNNSEYNLNSPVSYQNMEL